MRRHKGRRRGKAGIDQQIRAQLKPEPHLSPVLPVKLPAIVMAAMLRDVESGILPQVSNQFAIGANRQRRRNAIGFCQQETFRPAVGSRGIGSDIGDDGQVERRVAVTHPAAVFSGTDVQALMQPVFDAPILAIGLEHLPGVQLRGRTRGEEKLNFGLFGRLAWNLNPAREPGRLFRKGKVDAAGADRKGFQAPRFGTPAVDLRALGGGSCVPRGKRRAPDRDGVVARSARLRADCL